MFSDLIKTQVRHPIRAQHAFPGKIIGCAIAEEVGAHYPAQLTPFFDHKMPAPPSLPCVIKPVDGSNSQGVLPLIPVGGGHWEHIWTKETRLWSGWIGALHQARALSQATNGPFFGPWYAERMVNPPVDWKFYCIHGEPIWVRQHRKTGQLSSDCEVKCWEVDGATLRPMPYDVLIQRKQLNLDLPPPSELSKMIHVARQLALRWKRIFGDPFIRVDLFEGPLFGEFTPQPAGGKQVYRPEWDRWLGDIWMAGL